MRKGMASGAVIESFLDKGRGPVATVLVREGTLNKGDIVLCGFEYGRVRAMRNELGQEVLESGSVYSGGNPGSVRCSGCG
ncbi:translation initiation factor IF-2 [Citrobacter braakii]|nr:translation initiation factor IF-2 [Citrobacter braakii]